MKKRLVSLVAAAALLGSVSLATAGAVTTNGDTNITLGGSVQTFFDWANNQPNLGYMANPKYAGYNTLTKQGTLNNPAQTTLGTSAEYLRISLGLNNKAEGIKGLVEGDFFGGSFNNGGYQPSQAQGNFELSQAYVVKSFCQEGCNYTPWLLIGKTYDPLVMSNSFTLNDIAGIAGQNLGVGAVKAYQIGFGVKFDLGSVKLNPSIYAANLSNDINLSDSGVSTIPLPGYTALSDRLTSPGFGVKVPVEFATGLGAPAVAYAGFEWQPLKLTGPIGSGINSKDENAWMATAGLTLPVYFLNLIGNVHYERGMTGFDQPLLDNVYTMPSFYINQNGSVEAVRGTSWTAQAQVDFNKLAQVPFTVGLGYGQTVFSNYGDLADNTLNSTTPIARKMSTMFANVDYNLTKSLSVGVEYDRNKTYYIGGGNDNSDSNSNQVFLTAAYRF